MAKQVRSHASKATRRKIASGEIETLVPEEVEEQARARVRLAVDLDDQRPYDLQKTLGLEGPWNVTPQDLLDSNRRGVGSVLAIIRRLARPVIKVFANLEVPLYKQFKILTIQRRKNHKVDTMMATTMMMILCSVLINGLVLY